MCGDNSTHAHTHTEDAHTDTRTHTRTHTGGATHAGAAYVHTGTIAHKQAHKLT